MAPSGDLPLKSPYSPAPAQTAGPESPAGGTAPGVSALSARGERAALPPPEAARVAGAWSMTGAA